MFGILKFVHLYEYNTVIFFKTTAHGVSQFNFTLWCVLKSNGS